MNSNEFHTTWAKNWTKNYRDFYATNEVLDLYNVRDNVYAAQREFEKHLSELMNYGSHQPLY